MTSIVDVLRNANRDDLVSKPVKMELTRFRKKGADPVYIEVRPVSYAQWTSIASKPASEYRVELVRLAWTDVAMLQKSDVLDRYGAVSVSDLITKVFNPGEIAEIAKKVEDISGFGKSVIDLKN